MKYTNVKKLTQLMLIIALCAYIAGAFMMNRGADADAAIIAGTVLLGLSVVARLIWLRCPHCKRYISHKHLKDIACPYCRYKLED